VKKNDFIHSWRGVYYYYQLYIYLLIKKMMYANARGKGLERFTMLQTLSKIQLKICLAERREVAHVVDDRNETGWRQPVERPGWKLTAFCAIR